MAQGHKMRGRRASRQSSARDNGLQPSMMRPEPMLRPAPEMMTSWAEMTQTAMQEWLSMWSGAAQESLRLVTELQQANVEAARGLGENTVRLFSQAVGRARRAA
jgi:hypothetical protein